MDVSNCSEDKNCDSATLQNHVMVLSAPEMSVSHLLYRTAKASPATVSHCSLVVVVGVTLTVGEKGLVRLSFAIVVSTI